MKNIFKKTLMFLCLSSSMLNASWVEHWQEGKKFIDKEDFEKAEEAFTRSIKEIDNKHMHVYVERAFCRQLLYKYVETLEDVAMYLKSENMEKKYENLCYDLQMSCFSALKMSDENDLALEQFIRTTDFPIEEYTEDYVIITRLPECGCYAKGMKYLLVKSGQCESEDDITLYKKDRMLIGKLKKDRPKSCCKKCENEPEKNGETDYHETSNGGKTVECDDMGKLNLDLTTMGPECHPAKGAGGNVGYDDMGKTPKKETGNSSKGCKTFCDATAIWANDMCGRLKGNWCRNSCRVFVLQLRDLCHSCCEAQKLYEECLKYFDDVAKQFKNGICDPDRDIWD